MTRRPGTSAARPFPAPRARGARTSLHCSTGLLPRVPRTPARLLCPVVGPLLYCMPAVCRLPNGREEKLPWEIGESSDPLLRKGAPQIPAISRARKDSGAAVTRSADTPPGFCYFPPSRRRQPRHLVVAPGIATPAPLILLPRVLPLGPPRSLQSRHVALVLPSGTPFPLALFLTGIWPESPQISLLPPRISVPLQLWQVSLLLCVRVPGMLGPQAQNPLKSLLHALPVSRNNQEDFCLLDAPLAGDLGDP